MDATVVLTLIIVFIYLIGTVAIGIRAASASKVTTIGDIFTSSRSLGILALAFAIFGSQITAFGILGGPGVSYNLGYTTLGYLLGVSITAPIGFWIFGSRAWMLSSKFDYVTPVQFFKDRFNDNNASRYVVAAAQIILMVPYVLILGIGAGNVLNSVTNGVVPYWLGALIILIVCTFTAYSGGMKGTAWTNIFQGFIMLLAMLVLTVIVYYALGGGAAITAQLPENMISLGGQGVQNWKQWTFYSMLATGMSNGVFGHLLIRNMSAAHPRTLQLNQKVYPILSIIFWVFAVCLGTWGSIAIKGLVGAETESIVPLLAARFAPPWMIGLLAAGILSAIMSTWDGMILVMSSIFSEDFYKPIVLRSKKLELKEDLKISRFFILVISVLIYILVLLRPGSILAIGTFSFAGMATMLPPYFGCMYWKRTTSLGVILSSIVGVGSAALWAFGVLPASSTLGFFYGLPAFLLSAITMVVVSLLTKPAKQETIDVFFSAFSDVYED
ncbi:hypothetical protein J0B03_10115 [Alkalibacter rhizosphaerae]|uniref:Sodium:solute symporter family protein n=1 Tax=Alkalibacter rhizosphaerae TaxID=2815577 RepID=A0A974XE23_9FIRM|nr:hypothetical protein [Alkalibacter rhizosphaerae]QSX08144.1 hypothetical protein J0B03_10115 [Alkalibacter rhizosphaerae]